MSRVLGIDIGGTRSRARLVVEAEVIAETEARSASLAAEGPGAALDALDELVTGLPLASWCPIDVVCVGAAGMLGEKAQQLFSDRLGKLTMSPTVLVVSDAALVLPAADLCDGIGIVCGTGTAAFGRLGERTCLGGGWGYLLGDDGGGHGLVRSAIRVVLGRDDRGRPLGPLGDDLLEATGTASPLDLRNAFYVGHRPGKWAALAPVVLGSRDEAVSALLEEAARALDDMAGAVLEKLGQSGELPIVVAGGLTEHPRFQSDVLGYMRRARPGCSVTILQEPPVAGAVRLAQQLPASRR
jgi:N-acetylglucosamine kinase-like BadF-type ATPase